MVYLIIAAMALLSTGFTSLIFGIIVCLNPWMSLPGAPPRPWWVVAMGAAATVLAIVFLTRV